MGIRISIRHLESCVLPAIMYILIMRVVLANITTTTNLESQVIKVIKAYRETHNMSFGVIDFYLSLQNQSTRDPRSNHYFNVIENAWDHFLDKCK